MSSNRLDFCRLCFRESSNISVLDYVCDDAWSLADRIFECVSVQVSQNDKLPQSICQPCLDFVLKWCQFKTTCDRNQRTWFLWLKSLSYATPEELIEGLAEKAKLKSLELGHSRKSISPKHPFNSISLNPKNKECNANDVTFPGHESEDSGLNGVRIESTTSLNDFFIQSPNNGSPVAKHTNDYIIIDSEYSPVEQPDRVDSQSLRSSPVSQENDNSHLVSNLPTTQDHQTEKRPFISVIHTESIPNCHINIDDDINDHDDEVESAFCSGDATSDETIPQRELDLLNGNDSMDTDGPLSLREPSNFEENSNPFSIPAAKNLLLSSILKDKLLDSGKKNSAQILSEQPRRPDTPYPHEQLKNMEKLVDCSYPGKSTPQPQINLTSEDTVFTPPRPVPVSFRTASFDDINLSSNCKQNNNLVSTIKPVATKNLMSKVHTSSERMSESSDSNSTYLIDMGVRIKPEPVSEPEDCEEGEVSYSNLSIKMEPVEYREARRYYNQEIEPGDALEEPIDPSSTYCNVCRKRFSSNDSLVRHIQGSQTHKHISSFLASGHKVDSKMRSLLIKEVRSRAFNRAYAKKRMRSIDKGELIPTPGFEVPQPRENNKELLECKICNVTLVNRASKLRHESTDSHRRKIEELSRKENEDQLKEINLPLTMPTSDSFSLPTQTLQVQPITSQIQSMTYTCPFASCSAKFNDGGQLIVHMHTHGISLPIHEVNKQIELSQTKNQIHAKTNNKSSLTKNPSKPKTVISKLAHGEQSLLKFVCRRCNRGFPKRLSLSNHLRSCRGPIPSLQPFNEVCHVCKAPQKNKRTLSYHIKIKHPGVENTENAKEPVVKDEPKVDSNLKCSFCGDIFPHINGLKKHITMKHGGTGPLSCNKCDVKFETRKNLSRHYRSMHLKCKPGSFICYTCFKEFNSKSEIMKHSKRCALKLKIFSCSECDHSFKNFALLCKHKEEEHPVIVPKIEAPEPLDLSFLYDKSNAQCGLCEKKYLSYYNMKRHVRQNHPEVPLDVSMSEDNNAAPSLSASPAPPISDDQTSERNLNCFYCKVNFSTRSNMFHHMKVSCRLAPPPLICKVCKTERWPWLTGPCSGCGKEVDSRKRIGSFSGESVAKKIKTSDIPKETNSESPVSTITAPVVRRRKPSLPTSKFYKCPIGKRLFISEKYMLLHSSICNGKCKDKKAQCKICKSIFPNNKVYMRHKPCKAGLVAHTSKTETTSPMKTSITSQKDSDDCQKKNVIVKSKEWIETVVNSNGSAKCDVCPLMFKSLDSCRNHMKRKHKSYFRSKKRKESAMETNNVTATQNSIDGVLDETGSDEPGYQGFTAEAGTSCQSFIDNIPTSQTMCPSCVKPFPNHEILMQHIQNFHKNKITMIECSFCSKRIVKRALYEHGFSCIRDQLVSIRTLECVVCSTVFYNTDDEDTISLKLQEHIINCCGKLKIAKGERLRNKEKFLCLKCCTLFSSKKSLYAHSFKVHGILIQTSPTQPKPTAEKYIKSEDVEEPASEVPTEDVQKTTDVSFDSSISEAQYNCPRCPKSFKTSKGLKYHSKLHMFQPRKNKDIFQCKSCHRQFYDKTKLKNHEKVHVLVKDIVIEEIEKHSDPSSPISGKGVDQELSQQEVATIIGTVPES